MHWTPSFHPDPQKTLPRICRWLERNPSHRLGTPKEPDVADARALATERRMRLKLNMPRLWAYQKGYLSVFQLTESKTRAAEAAIRTSAECFHFSKSRAYSWVFWAQVTHLLRSPKMQYRIIKSTTDFAHEAHIQFLTSKITRETLLLGSFNTPRLDFAPGEKPIRGWVFGFVFKYFVNNYFIPRRRSSTSARNRTSKRF